jgi:hypothetical protein
MLQLAKAGLMSAKIEQIELALTMAITVNFLRFVLDIADLSMN